MSFSHYRLLARLDSTKQKVPRRPSITRKALANKQPLVHRIPDHHAHLTQANAHPFSIVIDKVLQNKGCAQRAELASEDSFGHRRSTRHNRANGLWPLNPSCDQESLRMFRVEKKNKRHHMTCCLTSECKTKTSTAFCTRPSSASETSRFQAEMCRNPNWVGTG